MVALAQGRGLVIDMFAGGGGASVGIRRAIGRDVDIAVNHDPLAIAMHAANHPHTVHVQEDVFSVNLTEYTHGRHVSFMWASPDCTHFSRARGGKPRSQHIRMLPWAVYEQAKAVRPDVIAMENVEEIRTWEDYDAFVASMSVLGYTFESRVLCAADFGARTSRTRWYAVLRCDGLPSRWPKRTNANKSQLLHTIEPDTWPLRTWKSVRPCLDLKNLGDKVFGRRRPLSKKTLARIAKGTERYCNGVDTQWLMSYYGTGVGQSIHDPLRTITCKDRFALVTKARDGLHMRMLTPKELLLAQGFPETYVIDHYKDGTRVPKAEQVRRIGNAVVPLMAERIVRANVAA